MESCCDARWAISNDLSVTIDRPMRGYRVHCATSYALPLIVVTLIVLEGLGGEESVAELVAARALWTFRRGVRV